MMKTQKNESKRTVRIFGLASFLNDMGSDMIYPIWPLFVTQFLHANMAALGLLDGLGEAIVSISQAASGYVSDKIRRRKIFIWTGYLFGSVSRIGYALSGTWQHLIPFRILDRAGKMRGAPRDAIIADVSTHENRGKNFGFLRTMDHMGAVIGILITISLIRILGYRTLFLLASIPSAIGTLLIIFLIKERKAENVKIYKGLSPSDLDRNFKLFMVLSAIFSLSAFSYSFLLIFAKQHGFSYTFVPVLYLIFTAVASLVSMPFGKLADRIGRKSVMVISFGFWGLVCLSFIFLHSYISILLTFVVYGLHKGALEPIQKTFVSELAPEKYRASSLGLFQMVIGLAALPASLLAGFFWDKINMEVPFYFSLALTVLATGMLFFVEEKRTKPS